MTSPLRDAAESATAGVPVVAWWEAPLRAAAEKATPGTWEARTMAGWVAGFEFFGGADNAFTFPLDLEQEDVDFINAAQPQNVLALLSELDTARAEIERLRGRLRDTTDERDNLSTIVATEIDEVAGAELDDLEERVTSAESALTAAQARIAELEAALKPFGEAGDIFEARAEAPPQSDEDPVHSWTHHKVGTRTITVGDFRHARATLSPVKENDRG